MSTYYPGIFEVGKSQKFCKNVALKNSAMVSVNTSLAITAE